MQAVDYLVQATSASGVANAGTGPKTASNSTTTQPPDKSCTLPCQKIQPEVATPPDKVLKEDVVLDEDIEQVRHWELINDLQHMNAHEYESPSLTHVKGRLKSHTQFWIDIQTPDFILDCIRDGYKIPFFSTLEPTTFKNNRSAQAHAEFVADAITELISSGRIHQTCKEQLLVISPLSVSVQQTGKKRLILDLRYVNQHVYKQRVKFDDWRTAINFFGKGTYFTKFDLKSGYHHLEIFPDHQPFLGFSWTYPDGNTCFYMFSVLPFGLSSAPYIFTKLLRPLIRHWRSLGIHSTIFLDDNIDMEKSFETSARHAQIVRADVSRSGLVANDDKSVWVPTQNITWLGLSWDGIDGTLAIASHRIEKLISTLNRVLKTTHVSARVLVSVVGQIISTGPVTGNLARIMSRHCQMSIASAAEWDTPFEIDQYCLHELKFWHTNVTAINSRSFTESLATNQTLYSDASATACGAFIEGKTHAAHRMFSSSEKEMSSTYRELLAIHFALRRSNPSCRIVM